MSTAHSSITTYLPALVAQRLLAGTSTIIEPDIERLDVAALGLHLAGFVDLTTLLSSEGPAGSEELISKLKTRYAELVSIISDHGGDIIRLSGTHLIVVWSPEIHGETLSEVALRAAQCGQQLQTETDFVSRATLSVGEILVTNLGGVYGRWEFLVTGPLIDELTRASNDPQAAQLRVSPTAWWDHLQSHGTGRPAGNDYVYLAELSTQITRQRPTLPAITSQVDAALRGYISGALLSQLGSTRPSLLAELLPITVMVIKLPGLTYETPIEATQAIVRTLQNILYDFEGSVDRIMMNATGTTFIAALGLPPVAHSDDAMRAVHIALTMHAELQAVAQTTNIGIASDRAFCSVIGSEHRSEYTIIGQLLERAEILASALPESESGAAEHPGLVLCDQATFEAASETARMEAYALPEAIAADYPAAAWGNVYQPLESWLEDQLDPYANMESWVDESLYTSE